MSPRKATRPTSEAESEAWRAGLLVASISLLLLLAPIVYRLTTRLIEEDHDSAVNTNVLAVIVTILFGTAFLLMSNCYIKHFGQHVMQNYQHQLRSFHQRDQQQRHAFLFKLFPMFANNSSHSSSTNNHANDKASSSFYSSSNQDGANQDSFNSRRKIDPKYFKPKFIIHELITFWDTTCTVITWGSFYVIGGTIVATEKISQRIKSRSPSQRGGSSSSIFGGDTNRNSSRGTGQSDFSFSSAFVPSAQQTSEPSTSEPQSNRQPFKRISSWTKRSINSIKKKYSRAVRSNAPQLTSGSANESVGSFFFVNNSTAAT